MGDVPRKVQRRTICAGCGLAFANHENHRRKSGCAPAVSLALCEEVDDDPTTGCAQDDFLVGVLDDAAAADVAMGLAGLKYERGFQRPDVEVAKSFAGVVGKRTREVAFGKLKGLLKDGVEPADVIAALESAGDEAFKGVETEAQEKAWLKRNLPLLNVRTTELVGDHRVASINVNDAIIRHLQESHAHPPSHHPLNLAAPIAEAGRATPPNCCPPSS